MRTEIHWVPECPVGKLALLARPRGGEWLRDEIGEWKQAGMSRVVSLLDDVEVFELDLEPEGEICRALGIEFDRFPIPDRGTPADRSAFFRLSGSLVQSLRESARVGIHSRMGIGRTSLVSVAILIGLGMMPNSAWDCVKRARGRPVPDTSEQREWLSQLSERT
jgi:protein-tyrosine phosphatase